MDDENSARAEAAHQEELLQKDRERIASREIHEPALAQIIDELREGGYFRPSEKASLTFPEPGKLGSPWKKQDGSWRKGFGKAVALCETTSLIKPPTDSDRAARYPKGDHFEKALLAAGYRVDVWPDYKSASSDVDQVAYYIYETDRDASE